MPRNTKGWQKFFSNKRLRNCWRDQGQVYVRDQIINIPVDVNNIIQLLPRQSDNDFHIYIHIKKLRLKHTFYFKFNQ